MRTWEDHELAVLETVVETAPRWRENAEIDSVALLTEPTLRAWEVPYTSYRTDADVDRIVDAWELARAGGHPAAVLLPFTLQ